MRVGRGKIIEVEEELWNGSTKKECFHCLDIAPQVGSIQPVGWATVFGSQWGPHKSTWPWCPWWEGWWGLSGSQSLTLLWGPGVQDQVCSYKTLVLAIWELKNHCILTAGAPLVLISLPNRLTWLCPRCPSNFLWLVQILVSCSSLFSLYFLEPTLHY